MSERAQNLQLKEIPLNQSNVPTYDVDHVLGDLNTAHLVLDGQVYTLRKTRQNKLILTK
ncbi:hemin uptake protein HemP [Paramylibacter kogurei]|uniref:hemin uptake protein HemP n=1 Tax=Paramylibacter kogurei TaxID=1889778 RepID=UPI000C14B0E2|nr:hemin uptake protein HemP [Amylibacter kogurei]